MVLTREKVPFTTHPYDVDPKTSAPTARRWRRRSASTRARVFKTLVATVDGQLGVGMVPVARTLDLEGAGARRWAEAGRDGRARGGANARPATSPAASRRWGGAPGCRSCSTTRLLGFETIFVSAGKRGLQLELSPTDLVHLAGAAVAPIAAGVKPIGRPPLTQAKAPAGAAGARFLVERLDAGRWRGRSRREIASTLAATSSTRPVTM